MYKFNQISLDKLHSCHPDLQILFKEVIRHVDCSIICGHRNQKDQDAAFTAGKSKLKFPNGKHNSNPSMAVDVAPFPIVWDNHKRFYWFGGYVMGIAEILLQHGIITHKVRYGGDWDGDGDITDQKFNDLLHFELVTPSKPNVLYGT